jgi:transposase
LRFVGDDWAEEHDDVELVDEAGRRLARTRLPEGIIGITRLHKLLAAQVAEDAEPGQVVVGIETDRGLWVQALIAAGYRVFAINPLQVARFRERHTVSGAKSDTADAHTLADMVRTDSHQLRPIAADSSQVEAIKVVARAHKTLIWERTRHGQRLRHALRDYFPAALMAFDELTAADTLLLLNKAPEPASAARLTTAQITVALRRARRRSLPERAAAIQAALRTQHLSQPAAVSAAYAVLVRAQVAILTALNEQIRTLQASAGIDTVKIPPRCPARERHRRTLRRDRQNRGHRPHTDLRRAAPANCPRPVQHPLQPPAAVPGAATSAATPRSSRPGPLNAGGSNADRSWEG